VTKSKELAAQSPSNQALVRRYSDSIAKSPKDIKHGEGVIVDRRGVAFGRPQFRRIVYAWRIAIYGAFIGGAVLAVSGAWIPGALLYCAGFIPSFLTKYRGTGTLMAIDVLLRQGHLDEAQRRFEAVPELRHRSPQLYCWLAGMLGSHRGDYATALKWWREAFPRAKGLRKELLKLSIAQALLLSGRTEEARRELEAVNFPPESDEVLTGQSLTRVMFALYDSSTGLPSHDELHEWARRALEYSHTGVELAALGWAFERSGDEDMARLLASEALERMHYPYLATWWPALQQWLDGRSKADAPHLDPVMGPQVADD
jgi:hypothetical protein